MGKFKVIICVLCTLLPCAVISQTSSTNEDDQSTLFQNQSYCFEFTWLGPQYDLFNQYNKTCREYLDDTRAKNVPCSPPFVITYDSTPPDINYLWRNHRTSVLCRRSKTDVCAKYTYMLNNVVVNTTYMCTKVRTVGEGMTTEGCFKQKKDGYDIELCVCESSRGIFKPCNGSFDLKSSILVISLLLVFSFLRETILR